VEPIIVRALEPRFCWWELGNAYTRLDALDRQGVEPQRSQRSSTEQNRPGERCGIHFSRDSERIHERGPGCEVLPSPSGLFLSR
jgi:hypothetical protein